MIPMITTSLRRNFAALSTMKPSPLVDATISAATSVVQPTPMRDPHPRENLRQRRLHDDVATTCVRVAPIEYAAWICSIDTGRTPARAAIASGAKIAR